MPTVTKSSIGRFDGLKLLASALLVAIIGVSSDLVAIYYHVSVLTMFLAWMGVGFIAKIAVDFRGLLKRPSFLSFIVAWLSVHLLVLAASWLYLGLAGWVAAMFVELALGYWLAHRIFKVYPVDVEQDPRREAGL